MMKSKRTRLPDIEGVDDPGLSSVLDDPTRNWSPARYPDFETGQMLRQGWLQVPIDSVVHLRREKADPNIEGDLPFVGMDDIEPDGLTVVQTRPFAEMKSLGNRFHPGDMLYGRLRPYLNKTATMDREGACSGELLVLTPSSAIDVRYLQYFMHSRRYVGWISGAVSGDRPRVSFETLAGFAIPLPPLTEQRRIVSRIDELFAEIDEGEAALAEARKGLDVFRRALLKAAVTGELTKDWREANPVAETGHDLLARIAKRSANKGSPNGRAALTANELGPVASPTLPEGWARGALGDFAEVGTGGTPLRSEMAYWKDGKIAWFTSAVANQPIASFPSEYITERALIETNCRVYPAGTLLVAMYGEGKTRGKITELAIPAACNQACAAIRIEDSGIRDWVKQWFSSFYLQLRARAAGGVQPNLNLEIVKSLSIPLPPHSEATEILRRVSDGLSAQTDTLTMLDAEAADAARLKQSILKAAFDGRLVQQDLADEPASALLARLAASLPEATHSRRARIRKSAS